MFRSLALGACLILCPGLFAQASGYLFYLEGQGVAGYSSKLRKGIYYSGDRHVAMQKPGLGFDYTGRFSSSRGDFGAAALQFRLALDQEKDGLEPQLYNAYFKLKTGGGYVWLGHNRPAFGLSSYFDSHGLLLPMLTMNGFGYDRDWGAGASRDFDWGDARVSFTSGSGMPLCLNGNYLFAARVSKGVLYRNDYNIGLSVFSGKPLMTVGYHLPDTRFSEAFMLGVDMTWRFRNFENRFEAMAGRMLGKDAFALFWRGGMNLMEEERLKLEIQPEWHKREGKDDCSVTAGVSFTVTPELAWRAMYKFSRAEKESRTMTQIYYYFRL